MVLGVLAVGAIYIAMNVTYMYALPLKEIAAHETIAHAAAAALFSPRAAVWLSLMIAISCFSAAATCTLSGARVYLAMAQDGVFFKRMAVIHPKWRTPAFSLIGQGVWAAALDAERTLRPALHLRDLRHGAVVHADGDRDVLAALEAAGDSAPVPLHGISVAARDLRLIGSRVDAEHDHHAAHRSVLGNRDRADRRAGISVLEAQQPRFNARVVSDACHNTFALLDARSVIFLFFSLALRLTRDTPLAESNPKRQADNISFLAPGVSIAEAEDPNRPRQVMGFRDLVLFYVITGISLRWIATAAAAGPSSIVIWIGAWFCFYTPLALSVLELSSRYPNEGGLYVWSKRAFGDFSGFMSAWTYWTSNLPYFPAVLYFAASNVLFMRQANWQHLSGQRDFLHCFFPAHAERGHAAEHRRTRRGQMAAQRGRARDVDSSRHRDRAGIRGLAPLRVGDFVHAAFDDSEHASQRHHFLVGADVRLWRMRDRIVHGRGNQECAAHDSSGAALGRRDGHDLLHPGNSLRAARAAFDRSQQPAGTGAGRVEDRVARGISRSAAAGGVSDCAQQHRRGRRYLAAVARLPFVAGLDRFLPPAFGALHPRWKTPWVALLTQFVLGRCVYFSGTGRNQRQRRLRRAGQHGRDYLLHSVFVFVRGDDQAAARAGGAGRDSRAGRKDGGEAGRDAGISHHDS